MKTKKLLSVILVFAMIIALVPTVSFAEAGTLEIVGSTGFISAPEGKYSKMPYKVNLDSSDVTDVAEVTVTKDGLPATDVWFMDGNLVVKGGAEGTYQLTASYESAVSEPKTINIIKTLTKTGGSGKLAANSVFGVAYGTSEGAASTTTTLAKYPIYGSQTLELVVNEGAEDDAFYTGDDWSGIRFKTVAQGSGYYINIHNGSKFVSTNKTELAFNTDQNLKLVIDFDNKKFSAKINGTTTVNNIAYTKTYNLNSAFNIKKNNCVTLFTCYSGVECPSPISITVAEGKSLFIPQVEGSAMIKLSAESVILGNEGYSWSIPTPTTGVSIDALTGILTVDNTASAGTVTVAASKNGYTGEGTITLKAINDEITEASPIVAGKTTIVADANAAGNYYIQSAEESRYNHKDIPYSNDGMSIVYDMMVRGTRCTFYFITTDGVWNYAQISSFGGYDSWTNANTWINLKVVVNPITNKFTAFLGGERVTIAKQSITSPSSPIDYVQVSFVDIDSIKIYNISDSTPLVTDAAISNPLVGGTAQLNYDFISLDGAADASEIAWSIATSENGAYDIIDGQTAKTLAVTDDMAGKWIKATITPKHKTQFDQTSYIAGEPVEVKVKVKSALGVTYSVKDSYESQASTPFTPGDALADGKYFVATVEITQMDDTARNVMIAIAKYSESGDELIAVDCKTLSTASKGASDINSIVIDKTGGKMKLFVWDNATLAPIRNDIIK